MARRGVGLWFGQELACGLVRRSSTLRALVNHLPKSSHTRRNHFRIRQFFEAYLGPKKVSPLVTQLPGPTSHHPERDETQGTREVYILAAIKERWFKRELERQIRSGAVLRTRLAATKVSPAARQIHPTAVGTRSPVSRCRVTVLPYSGWQRPWSKVSAKSSTP